MKRNAFRRMLSLWPLLVCMVCLAVSVGVYAVYGQHNLDSDISSEFVLAQLLNEEGRFFLTDEWYYSTELRIVSPVPVYQIALRLFEDWHMARTFSIAVLLAGVMASFVFLVRGAGVSMQAALLCAAALVLPVSQYQAFTLTYGGFYTVCVMLTFIEIGLVLRMGKGKWLQALLLVILGVYGGLNGVRMLMICTAPLLVSCAIVFFLDARRCENLKKLTVLPSFGLLLGGIICAAATGAGYVINSRVLARAYDFAQYNETVLSPLTAQMFTDQIICLMRFFGYRDQVLLLSLQGVVSVLAALLPAAGAAAAALLLSMKLNARERLLAVFTAAAMALGMVINVLTLSKSGDAALPYSVSYYMPAALLFVFALFWVFDRFACKLRLLRVLPMLALVGVFILANAAYREEDLNTYETELEDIAQCLLDEGAYEGYATFWNANVLTEITDGEIGAFAVEDWKYGDMNEWLQRKEYFDRAPVGPIFAVFGEKEWKEDEPGYDSEKLIYASDAFYVVVYDTDEEFREAVDW